MAYRIGGILYPSEQWYRENILAKGKETVGGREVAISPSIKPPPEEPPPPEDGGDVGGGFKPIIPGAEDPYKDIMLKALTNYLETVGKQKPWKELYEEESEALGIPGQKKLTAGLQQQVLDVEELLDKLEGDISGRVSGQAVTEAQRRRILAAEGAPLREQLADLMRAESRASAGLGGAREELATMMGLEEKERAGIKEMGLGMLPYYKEALTYETPTEESKRKLAEMLETERALKKEELGKYYKEVTEIKPNVYRTTDDEGNTWQLTFDPYTMKETDRVNLGKIGKEGGKTDASRIATINRLIEQKKLKSVATPSGYASVRRELTAEDYEGLAKEWIRLGGAMADFKIAYPAERLLSETEFKKVSPMVIKGEDDLAQWEERKLINQWLSSEGATLSDEEKALQIRMFGYNPEDFGIY